MKSARFFRAHSMHPYLVGEFSVGADEICPFFSGAFHAPLQLLVGEFSVGADGIRPFFRAHFMSPYSHYISKMRRNDASAFTLTVSHRD